jgi:uncharacterized protein involved in exopolysaccharide biosynthesis
MPNSFEPESFDPIEYLEFLRKRWKIAFAAVALAGAVAAVTCLFLPKQYTATATLVIAPPGDDPRAAIAVSPIYLESLKAYERFASSDSLFAQAAENFHLMATRDPSALESFKRKVLRVEKPKDTQVLEIGVTLQDPAQARQVLQFLTREVVALDRKIAQAGNIDVLEYAQSEFDKAQKELERTRTEASAVASSGSEPILESEAQSLAEVRARAEGQHIEANMALADSQARGDQESSSTARARLAALTADAAVLDKQIADKSAALARLRARRERANDELRSAEDNFEAARKRLSDTTAAARLRGAQLRVVDPGIVPQRPSFPNLPLITISAIVISLVLSLIWLTVLFGLARRREQPARGGLRVAGGGGR